MSGVPKNSDPWKRHCDYNTKVRSCLLFQLDNAYSQVVDPLEEFRKKYIGDVKKEKKRFDKQTAKFCSCQERYLNLTTKKPNSLQEVRCLWITIINILCLPWTTGRSSGMRPCYMETRFHCRIAILRFNPYFAFACGKVHFCIDFCGNASDII